ncbi:MAG: ABC transporter permease [Pirellulales bacterium]|nr:ABC transporter permease [Pirellulales bacterium]
MALWKFTSREIRNRPGRAILTLLSIVIGVAAVVAVTISTATTNQAYKEMFESVTGKASFEVVPSEDTDEKGWFPDSIAANLEKVEGVTAVPSIQRDFKIYSGGQRPICLLVGIDPKRSEIYDSYQLSEGVFFHADSEREAILEAGFAKGLGVKVGDSVRVPVPSRRSTIETLKVVGLFAPKSAANFNQGGVIFVPLAMAQYLIFDVHKINRIGVVLDKSLNEEAVRGKLQSLLPPGVSLIVPSTKSQFSKETLQQAEQGLRFAFALSIALAVFMIFNTFLMNIGERRKQLAILRAIGTTRGQIMRMLLTEALAMGTLGTVLGCLAGVGGAYLLTAGMTSMFNGAVPALTLTPTPFFLAAFLGPAMSLIGVYIPAYLAGKITPLEGMRPVVSESKTHISKTYVAASLAFFGLIGAILTACISGWLPLSLLIPTGVVFTAAIVLLVPIVLGPLSRGSAFALYPLLKTEGQIASRQILRRRVRTTLTIGILYIAVSTAVSMGTSIINSVSDVQRWYGKATLGDFIVRPATATQLTATVTNSRMPESMREEIRALPGVKNVDSVSYVLNAPVRAAGSGTEGKDAKNAMVIIRDFTDRKALPFDLKGGSPDEVRDGLAQGNVVLGTVLGNRIGAHAGDDISVETAQGTHKLRVVGETTAYVGGGMVVYMEGARARQLMGIDKIDAFILQTDSRGMAETESRLKEFCKQHNVLLFSFAQLRMKLDALLNGVVGSLWGLMILGFVVGAFGMANTLSMNVLEQTRELALLRVVAMTRRQVRKTILAQAAIIGFIGLLTGTLGGLVGSWTINLCSIPLFGQAVPFAIHPLLLAACFTSGLAIILLAAWIPAERAARLNLLIALQYE